MCKWLHTEEAKIKLQFVTAPYKKSDGRSLQIWQDLVRSDQIDLEISLPYYSVEPNVEVTPPLIKYYIGDEDHGLITQIMATQYGIINQFSPDKESITTYLERMNLYFTANSVANEEKVPILLSVIGSSTYSLFRGLLAPDAPNSKSLSAISKNFKQHFEPPRAIIAERLHFHKRNQAMDEPIAAYEAALRRLATTCKFEGYLEDALRDRLVCGLRSEAIQRKDLDHKKAMELADRNSKALKEPEPGINKHNIQSSDSMEKSMLSLWMNKSYRETL